MNRYGFIALICLLFELSTSINAQQYQHTALWLRFAPTWEINNRWNLTADVWYRRQSDLHAHPLNPIAAPLLSPSGRVGVSYRTTHWAFTFFPVSLFRSYPSLGKEADYGRPRSIEFRPSALVEWSHPLPHQWTVRLRAGYEYRRFADAGVAGRARFRAMLRYAISPLAYASLWNETLLPVAPNNTVRQLCEINRTNLSLGQSVTKHLILEAGYQFSYRQRRTLVEFDEEHALTLTSYYRF